MADSANAAGWRVSAATLCGTARDNAIGGEMRWDCGFAESITGVRVTPATVLDHVTVGGDIECHKFVTPITPGTSGTSSFTVTQFGAGTATVSCANTLASSGAISGRSAPMSQRQEFRYNPGDTETLMPISVS